MKIARVFPRRTKATPDDDLAFVGPPPRMFVPEVDEVHVSVAFSYDREWAEDLAYQWEALGVPVKVGGFAYGDPGGEDDYPCPIDTEETGSCEGCSFAVEEEDRT